MSLWRPLRALATICVLVMVTFVGCGALPDQSPRPSGMTRQAPSQAGNHDLRVSFIDVGKGDCILVEADGEAALIDAGYENTSNKVLSYLRERGVDQLRCLILTHYDKDHIGGFRAIAGAIPIEEVCLPNYESADKNYRIVMDAVKNLGLVTCQATNDTVYGLGETTLTVIPTSLTYEIKPREDEGNDNDLSLVVALTNRDDSYLFAGDLEKEGIVAYLGNLQGTFDVLKMPHHGEWCGKTDELVEDTSPRIVIITDGEDDPAEKKTLNYLNDADADMYRTSTDGTIVVESHGLADYTVTTQLLS